MALKQLFIKHHLFSRTREMPSFFVPVSRVRTIPVSRARSANAPSAANTVRQEVSHGINGVERCVLWQAG